MGEFCEFDIDFEQFDDLRAVVVHDECGAHEDVWFYRLDGLKDENAKLRELCGMLYGRLQAAEEATEMGWVDARLTSRMRELGIEVE